MSLVAALIGGTTLAIASIVGMPESEPVKSSDPFLQGDILQLVDAHGRAVAPAYGVIINADCDLAHCKIDGVVAYLPLFPFETYFRPFGYLITLRQDGTRSLTQFNPDAELLKLVRTYVVGCSRRSPPTSRLSWPLHTA